ncbi:MAG: hypothetical protein V4608_03540 [Bacteroidota bacterium]
MLKINKKTAAIKIIVLLSIVVGNIEMSAQQTFLKRKYMKGFFAEKRITLNKPTKAVNNNTQLVVNQKNSVFQSNRLVTNLETADTLKATLPANSEIKFQSVSIKGQKNAEITNKYKRNNTISCDTAFYCSVSQSKAVYKPTVLSNPTYFSDMETRAGFLKTKNLVNDDSFLGWLFDGLASAFLWALLIIGVLIVLIIIYPPLGPIILCLLGLIALFSA